MLDFLGDYIVKLVVRVDLICVFCLVVYFRLSFLFVEVF